MKTACTETKFSDALLLIPSTFTPAGAKYNSEQHQISIVRRQRINKQHIASVDKVLSLSSVILMELPSPAAS